MQRRATKSSSPHSSPSERASEKESDGKMTRRRSLVTPRIWFLIGVVLFVVGITRLGLPDIHAVHYPQTATQRLLADMNRLKPKNYLNVSASDETNPFAFCPAFGKGDEVGARYGAQTIAQSRVHLGSGARVHRVLQKALTGQPLTISVLGGSVSACHGAGDDPVAVGCYPSRFFDWWNTVFPHPASELTNGAVRHADSSYFAFCSAHHLPDQLDLVILEFDTDDPNDDDWIEHFELLVRSILLRPDKPAVIVLGHFSPQLQRMHGFVGPEFIHSTVAQYYDVPHISTKPVLYARHIRDPSSINKYYADPILANPTGHELLSDILIAYIQAQTCQVWESSRGRAFDVVPPPGSNGAAADKDRAGDSVGGLFGGQKMHVGVAAVDKPEDVPLDNARPMQGSPPLGDTAAQNAAGPEHLRVPAARMRHRPGDERRRLEAKPYCVSANDLINPLPPSLFEGTGWHAQHPGPSSSGGDAHLRGTSNYWYSTLPASKLHVPLRLSAGDVALYYIREKPTDGVGGSAVECWVDDNYAGKVTITNEAEVDEPTATLALIDMNVSVGSHFIECALLGEEGEAVPAFKILGVFST